MTGKPLKQKISLLLFTPNKEEKENEEVRRKGGKIVVEDGIDYEGNNPLIHSPISLGWELHNNVKSLG